MSEKSPDAFRTISEIAEELDLPQHVLRFWETKFSQIRPTKRSSGRRFYRPDDVVLIRTIRDLLYRDGYTIRGVQQLLREHGAKGLVAPSPVNDSHVASGSDQPTANSDMAGSGQENERPSMTGSPRAHSSEVMDPFVLVRELRVCLDLLRNARNAN